MTPHTAIPPRSSPAVTRSAEASFLIETTAERYVALVLTVAGVTALLLSIVVDRLPGASPGFGRIQLALAAAGAAAAAVGSLCLVAPHTMPASWTRAAAVRLDELIRFLPVAVEVGALVLVLRWFRIESPVFYERLALLTFGGFLIHHHLPLRARLPFFALLSGAGIVMVFGWIGGGWVIGIGIGLIALCHLPIRFAARVALLVAAGCVLAALRGNLMPAPIPAAVWPILGSMFMFRLILYMYEIRHAREPMHAARTLSYFFLLPNVAFPLFPVVDYATFRRTYYDRPALEVYAAGVRWMLVGVTHLIAYRVVYQYFTLPAAEVASAAHLARYMLATFLLYLKVSGQFHLIVGMLHLFGFRLPESHRFFYLASSFTDFWRRINIYWKDFMTKVFYFPLYFRLRKRGDTFALVVSTLFVFFATWSLHSYQWFWLLGTVLLSWPDVLFWGLLAVFLVANSVLENRRGRTRRLGNALPQPVESLRYGAAVTATFTTLCVLWSLWSSHSVGDWLRLWRAAQLSAADLGLASAVVLGVVFSLAAGHQLVARAAGQRSPGTRPTTPSLVVNAAWLVLFALLGSPAVTAQLGVSAQVFARDLRIDKLNRADADLLHRGYYENLTGVNQFNSRLWEAYAQRPSDWKQIWETEVISQREDFPKWDVVPLAGILFNGTTLRTNRWGMRDGDYDLLPPPGTYRIALAGASFAMGQGVNDHETFEQLVEHRLNSDSHDQRIEILNFSVPAYTPVEQAVLLEEKILPFKPHALFIVGHPYDAGNSARHVARRFLRGVTMPYPYLDGLIAAAGLTPSMSLDEASARLWQEPFKTELLEWSLRRIVNTARAADIQPVWILVTTPGAEVPEREIDGLVRSATHAGFTVLDLRDAYGDVPKEQLRVAAWDDHPNAAAHRMIADRLYEAFLPGGPLASLRN